MPAAQVRDARFPLIDYGAHPAFAPLVGPYIYDDELIASTVERIDATHWKFVTRGSPVEADAKRAVIEIRELARTIERHAREVRAPILALEWLGSALEWALVDLRYEYVRLLNATAESRGPTLDETRREQLHGLQTRGMYIADLDERDYGEIVRLVTPRTDALRSEVASNPPRRAVYSPSRVSLLGRGGIRGSMPTAG